MRRSASQILRNLEQRIARLERTKKAVPHQSDAGYLEMKMAVIEALMANKRIKPSEVYEMRQSQVMLNLKSEAYDPKGTERCVTTHYEFTFKPSSLDLNAKEVKGGNYSSEMRSSALDQEMMRLFHKKDLFKFYPSAGASPDNFTISRNVYFGELRLKKNRNPNRPATIVLHFWIEHCFRPRQEETEHSAALKKEFKKFQNQVESLDLYGNEISDIDVILRALKSIFYGFKPKAWDYKTSLTELNALKNRPSGTLPRSALPIINRAIDTIENKQFL